MLCRKFLHFTNHILTHRKEKNIIFLYFYLLFLSCEPINYQTKWMEQACKIINLIKLNYKNY